jgi:hypothetical protein
MIVIIERPNIAHQRFGKKDAIFLLDKVKSIHPLLGSILATNVYALITALFSHPRYIYIFFK